MNTYEFFNARRNILVKIAPDTQHLVPKSLFVYNKVSPNEFHIRTGDNVLSFAYDRVSSTHPDGHKSIEDLFIIFKAWLSKSMSIPALPILKPPVDVRERPDSHASPLRVFDFAFRRASDARKFNALTIDGGKTLFIPDEQCARLSVCDGVSRSLVQSKKYIQFIDGGLLQVHITSQLRDKSDVASVVSQVGYFDDINDKDAAADSCGSGVFVNMDERGMLSLVLRACVGGSQIDRSIARAAWNIDRLDGSGVSGYDLDPIQTNTFVFEISMEAACVVHFGVVMSDGRIAYAHRFSFMPGGTFNPSLPIRMDIKKKTNSPLTNPVSARLISGLVLRDLCDTFNTLDERTFSIDSQTAAETNLVEPVALDARGSVKPIISLRVRSSPRCRTSICPVHFVILNFSEKSKYKYKIVLNSVLNGAAWSSAGLPQDSAAEYDMASTGATGGVVIASGYTSNQSEKIVLSRPIDLYASIDGASSDTITIIAGCISGACQLLGEVEWIEK